MLDLVKIFRAGAVRRWHTNPDLAHTVDRIDGHSARVARIILALHPDPNLYLIRAALVHDDGESVTGDIPATCEKSDKHQKIEDDALRDLWGGADMGLTPTEAEWLKLADRLDAYMWAKHHAPHVMDRYGWPEMAEETRNLARKLGVGIEVGAVLG